MQLVGTVGQAKGIQLGVIETGAHNYKIQDTKLFIATQKSCGNFVQYSSIINKK